MLQPVGIDSRYNPYKTINRSFIKESPGVELNTRPISNPGTYDEGEQPSRTSISVSFSGSWAAEPQTEEPLPNITVLRNQELVASQNSKNTDLIETVRQSVEEEPSLPYSEIKRKDTIKAILQNLEGWKQHGLEESLSYVAEIKDLITKNYDYFKASSQTRIFANTLLLLFKNSNWSRLKSGQLKVLLGEVNRFVDDDFSQKQLDTFIKQTYRIGLTPIKKT